ncbi:retrovirus-related pol polyprotein from transposon TNT 1-94 [Tanacetum coccineum]
MRALLIQHECEVALEVLPVDMEAQTKAELNKKAHSAVILCLGNKVLREVTRETTAAEVWSKLETLYMTKSLANKLYLKKKLYTFYMPAGRKISEHIGREATLNLKEIKERSKAKGDDGEGLYVRGRNDRRDSHQSKGKSRSKSQGGRLKCYICQSEDHLKRNCSKNNRKKSTCYVKKDDQPSSSSSTYDYSELGDSRECKIRGIGKVRIQLKDGSSFMLHNVRVILFGIQRDNCVYSLDGHAMAGELNASVEEKDSLAQGQSQVESLGGKRYFLSIVDDYSRRVWVYIPRFKHEAFEKFKEWKQLVENQTRRTVKKLRTDNGLEFCNREFKQLCVESGIARHLIVSGTP